MHTIVMLGALLLTFAVGCSGPPSTLDSCKHFCDKQGSCNNSSSSQINACKQNCDSEQNDLADAEQKVKDTCANADEVLSQTYDCAGNYCSQSDEQDCVSNIVCKAK